MNKLLLGALPLVAGASWAGTTLYSGSQSEDAYAQLVQQLDQMSGYSVKQEAWEPGRARPLLAFRHPTLPTHLCWYVSSTTFTTRLSIWMARVNWLMHRES